MWYFVLIGCVLGAAASGQDTLRVPSNFLHHIQGKVYLDGKQVGDVRPGPDLSQFHALNKGSVLGTGLGLAEIMMSPGLIVRVGENTEVVLVAPDILELTRGAISIEAVEIKDGGLSVRNGRATLAIRKPGAYWVGGEPVEARVYDGQAELVHGGVKRFLKRGQALAMAQGGEPRNLDVATTNSLMRWSRQRGHYLSMASAAAAWSMFDGRIGWAQSGWLYNPHYGMYGFVLQRGRYCGWYGNCYYAPSSVQMAFTQPVRASTGTHVTYGYDANNGYAISSQRTYETASPQAASPSAPAATAVAPEKRSSESPAPRGSEGGGRSQ